MARHHSPVARRFLRLGVLALVVASNASCAREAANEADWQSQMIDMKLPKVGCFTAAFPKLEWTETACVTPPPLPYPPGVGNHNPQIVGGTGTDYAAVVTGTMTSATGTFPTVTGVTSETGLQGGTGGQVANIYSLQLNTRPFTTSVCSSDPNCQGWQQFIYSSGAEQIFIQYWLLSYNTTCPSGWTSYPYPGPTDTSCYRNGPNATTVARQPITNLASLSLTGSATAGGNDTIIMSTGTSTLNAANQDTILNLAGSWTAVEFAIVGDCCSAMANFNAGATVEVRTTVHNGTTNAPTCIMRSYTGESNNLTLVGAGTLATGAAPAIQSSQSNVAGTAASCATAAGIGDPHLRTFIGLMYDFQATGDFVLAGEPDFAVHARQISGGSRWPNVAVNAAVATRMGDTRVAVCGGESPLVVDGALITVDDGKVLELPSGVYIIRTGNVYLVIDQAGNSMRAAVNSGWIDVSVGLGSWPADVHGLLANPDGNAEALAGRDGAVITIPLTLDELYGKFGESWRVPPDESMLDVCGAEREHGTPSATFGVKDLDQAEAEQARATCLEAGAREGAVLDACIIDVVVLGKDAAAVYAGVAPPLAVGQ